VPPPPPDQPVASSEPRQSAEFLVDLEPGPNCEEAFDLELYQHRGVDLVEWDDQTRRCEDRRISVRYLPNRISAEALAREVARCARRARPTSSAQGEHRPEVE
jgi:hypothetical protein